MSRTRRLVLLNVLGWAAIAWFGGVGDAIRRSVDMFKRTWGENLAAQVGLGLVGFVAVLPGIIVGGLLAATGVTAIVVVGVVAAVVWIAGVIVVMSALTAIFQAALYMYARDGQVPDGFDSESLANVFT